jgi:Cu-Zn family superoxide dismutase
VSLPQGKDPTIRQYMWILRGVKASDLWGRSVIVHADPDDLGLGEEQDSKTTGHSGKRIACAVIGRSEECES